MILNMKKFLLLSAIVLSFPVFGQHDNCKVLLTDAIRQMKTATGKGYHMVYEIKTEFKTDGGLKEYKMDAEVIVNNEKSSFISSNLNVYKDSRYMVTINKEAKVIYLANAVTNSWKKFQAEAFSILHDTLLNKAQIVDCETSCPEKQNEQFVDKIKVQLPVAYKDAVGIEYMIYWINSENKQIVRCVISYINQERGIQSVDFVIKEYTHDYRQRAYEGDALSKVMSRNNKLNVEYKDYRVKDIR
jgi:hypothetical protein